MDNNIYNKILNFCDFNTKINLNLTSKDFYNNINSLEEEFLKEKLKINYYDNDIKNKYFKNILIEFIKFNNNQEFYKSKNIFNTNKLNQNKIITFLTLNLLNNNTNIFWQILLLNYIIELRKKHTSIIYQNIKYQNKILDICDKNNDIINKLKYKINITLPN